MTGADDGPEEFRPPTALDEVIYLFQERADRFDRDGMFGGARNRRQRRRNADVERDEVVIDWRLACDSGKRTERLIIVSKTLTWLP